MNDWNIQSRAHACQACAKPFADKQPYHTLLFDEKQNFQRLDVCQSCWQAQFSQGATERKGFVSYWQGTYEAPAPAAPEAIQKENAESLLRKIIALQDVRYGAAGFILAVMLERKRVLKVKEQFMREGQRVFIYEQPGSGDVFTIVDPNLQLDQLDTVQREVAHLLEHGLALGSTDLAPPGATASAVETGMSATPEPASQAEPVQA